MLVYHRFIGNIEDLRFMFDGKVDEKRIMEWKNGQLEFLIEIMGHPYNKIFFNKPKLVNKWRDRISDPENIDEIKYRKLCEEQMRSYLRPRGS